MKVFSFRIIHLMLLWIRIHTSDFVFSYIYETFALGIRAEFTPTQFYHIIHEKLYLLL